MSHQLSPDMLLGSHGHWRRRTIFFVPQVKRERVSEHECMHDRADPGKKAQTSDENGIVTEWESREFASPEANQILAELLLHN